MYKLNSSKGHTLLELLVSLFITGIIMMSGYQFYITMHNQTLTQDEISEMQQRSRASLHEIGRTLRMAGYKIGSHDAYHVNGDSLSIFFSDTQPVDTVTFFLAQGVDSESSESETRYLMRKRNSEEAFIYSDYIESMEFNVLNPSEVEITLVVQATKPDEDYAENDGLRQLTVTERVSIRNADL